MDAMLTAPVWRVKSPVPWSLPDCADAPCRELRFDRGTIPRSTPAMIRTGEEYRASIRDGRAV